MKNYLNITQLSKILNVSSETLRHYDRIGLFKPDYVDPDTHYRYYSISAIEKIDTILELRNMGMKLSDIQYFIENRTLDLSYELLKQKEKDLSSEYSKIRMQLKTIREKLKNIKKMKNNDYSIEPGAWAVKELGEEKFIVTDSFRPEIQIKEYLLDVTKLKRNLNDRIYIFATNYVYSLIEKNSFSDEKSKSFLRKAALPYDLCKKDDGKNKYTYFTAPPGLYLCGSGRKLFKYNSDTHYKILQWLKDNEYKICGDIIESDNIDISLTNELNEVIFDFRVPIKKL